jgi:hypothetical protein
MLHMVKLAVGIRDVAHLRQVQSARLLTSPPLRHQTRNAPRRAAELLAGGSMYWVIAGAVVVRQRLLDIVPDHWDDETKCTGLVLDPMLVPVAARPMKAFQGWRYLENPPEDLTAEREAGTLPETMRAELRALGLL